MIREHLRKTFLSGLLLLVPLVLTYLILKSLFVSMDDFAKPLAHRLWGISFPGLGILLAILFFYGVGLVSTNLLGRALFERGERLLVKVPLVKTLYVSVKEILQIFFAKKNGLFRGKVVFVEYPKKGFRTLAIQTNEFQDAQGHRKCLVFIPTVPNPTSGSLAIFPESEVTPTALAFEDAARFFFSAGLLNIKK